MKLQTASGALALAVVAGIVACNSDLPTSPKVTAPQTTQMQRSGPQSRGQSLSFDVTGPLTRGTDAVGTFAGTFNVTSFSFDQATHQLMVTGVLNGTETLTDGTTASIVDKVVTTTATLKRGGQTASTGNAYQFASNTFQFTASCGILLLDLGPLHLDLLGLVLDLNEVVLDLTAQTGANNLLGNLLCALTGLLDIPGAIAGIINLIDSINNLLGTLGGLAAPASLPLIHGGAGLPAAVAILRSA
jgi:hypothetical protein